MLAALLCMFTLDQPVARYVASHAAARLVFQAFAAPSLLALPVSGLYLAYAVIRGRASEPVWLAASLAALASTALKDELKWIFGRPWPQTWLEYGISAWHPFADSSLFGAFPSGHTAYISGPLCVLWMRVPRLRWLWGGLIFLVMLGLVGAGYHFISDVLAGLVTGMLAAWGTLALMPGYQGRRLPS